ncbi:MAG: aminotransferase class V-fold PLP-dependent enzyme [Polyangiaceae bacterium]|nr:aminotransferase class V-fold PLP-dependent enzyme [Polyangiaceae bacterium]
MSVVVAASYLYFDWNATAPPLPEATDAARDAARSYWGNPSSVHAAGREAWAVVERLQQTLAQTVGVDPRDVLLTSGATEANNTALRSAQALVTSRLEHPSVVRVAEHLAKNGIAVVWLEVPADGRLGVSAVRSALAGLPAGAVVAVSAVNHETGIIQPVAEIAEVTRRAGARLHVDAVQALGKVSVELWASGDSIALASHKIRGPKGIGALLWRGASPVPLLLGGDQQRGLRAGTLDAAAAAGFDVALRHAAAGGIDRYAALGPLRDRIEKAVVGLCQVNGSPQHRVAHVTSLSAMGWRSDELVAALDLAGICVSSGSACSAGSVQPSPVVAAMLGPERAASTIRVSIGELTKLGEVDEAIAVLLRILRRHAGLR